MIELDREKYPKKHFGVNRRLDDGRFNRMPGSAAQLHPDVPPQ
jgi:hypothetical protein